MLVITRGYLSDWELAQLGHLVAERMSDLLQEEITEILRRYAETGDVSEVEKSYQQILDSGQGLDWGGYIYITLYNFKSNKSSNMKLTMIYHDLYWMASIKYPESQHDASLPFEGLEVLFFWFYALEHLAQQWYYPEIGRAGNRTHISLW